MTLSDSLTGALKISLLILSEFNQINLTKKNFFGNYVNLFSLKKAFIVNKNVLLELKQVTSS